MSVPQRVESELRSEDDVDLRRVLSTWWPLALSWTCMAAELPALTAAMSRLPDPKVHLAAYGGVVFPVALIIESPVIMLLAASTALSRDRESYRQVYRYMQIAGALLTALHALVAFTPLFDVVVVGLLRPPPETVEPARLGLAIMLPWTWAIGHRRFQQGLLIRRGYARAVGWGTLVRIGTVLCILLLLGRSGGAAFGGVAVACTAVIGGVLVELAYVAWISRPAVAELPPRTSADLPLTWPGFVAFYLPLVLTSLLGLLALPIGAAAMARLPRSLDSLAAWPALDGLLFILQGAGVAFNEVVVALYDRRGGPPALRRFTVVLSASLTGLGLILLFSPAGTAWFEDLIALRPDLVPLALLGLWLSTPIIALTPWLNWYQGRLVQAGRTRGITEGTMVHLAVLGITLPIGLWLAWDPGLAVVAGAMTAATLLQVLWLRHRAAQLPGQERPTEA